MYGASFGKGMNVSLSFHPIPSRNIIKTALFTYYYSIIDVWENNF